MQNHHSTRILTPICSRQCGKPRQVDGARGRRYRGGAAAAVTDPRRPPNPIAFAMTERLLEWAGAVIG